MGLHEQPTWPWVHQIFWSEDGTPWEWRSMTSTHWLSHVSHQSATHQFCVWTQHHYIWIPSPYNSSASRTWHCHVQPFQECLCKAHHTVSEGDGVQYQEKRLSGSAAWCSAGLIQKIKHYNGLEKDRPAPNVISVIDLAPSKVFSTTHSLPFLPPSPIHAIIDAIHQQNTSWGPTCPSTSGNCRLIL